MAKQPDNTSKNSLDEATLELLAEHQQPIDIPIEKVARMRDKLFNQIQTQAPVDFITIRLMRANGRKLFRRFTKNFCI